MVHTARAHPAIGELGLNQHIDVIAQRVALGGKTKAILLLGDFAESHGAEDGYRPFIASLAKRHPEEATDGVSRRNIAGARGLCLPCVRVADDLQAHAVRVGKAEDLLFKPLASAFRWNTRGQQAVLPELQRWERNAECGRGSFSYPQASARGMRPGEECKDRARRPGIISKVEVIGSRIVEVDGALYKTKPQNF